MGSCPETDIDLKNLHLHVQKYSRRKLTLQATYYFIFNQSINEEGEKNFRGRIFHVVHLETAHLNST